MKSKTVTHTPTPWIIRDYITLKPGGILTIEYHDKRGRWVICEMECLYSTTPQDKKMANAAFIVLAVNAHEALLDALKLQMHWTMRGSAPCACPSCKEARKAIAKAEGR